MFLLLVSLGAGGHVELSPSLRGKLSMVDLLDFGSGAGTLALRLDTMFVAGFANRSGHWHTLRGSDHLFHDHHHQQAAPPVTPLPFGNSYDDLVGGVNNLRTLPLGSSSWAHAAVVLSANDPDTADDGDVALKRALATMTLLLCEPLRLRPIAQTMLEAGRMGRVAGEQARIADEHLPYIEHWDAMWHELRRWRRRGEWGGPFTGVLRESANIGSAEEALAVVGWTFRQKLLGDDGSAPAMCQVLSVSAAQQQQQDPPGDDLVFLKLCSGGHGNGDESVLAMHRHDISFAGFTNGSHHWHVFRGDEDAIPNARRLPFRNTYRDLIGGLDNVPDLPLGKAAAARATGALASYDPDAAGEEETPAVKRLVRWKRTGKWDGPFTELLRKRAGIHTADEALAIAKLLANRSFDYGSGVGTFAVRPDVFSVAGFANRTGHWHALRGNEHLFVGREATPLPFGSNYDDLVGGVNNLLGLPLGEPFRSYATVVLSGYDATAGNDEAAVKRALATLAVVICEGQRLHPIIETILTGRGARVAAEL
uniref:rRNA N-glycosidase n=1 Tax=Oryza punctata TaxID=4537 RepID=A0A0E0KHK8_ORYPU